MQGALMFAEHKVTEACKVQKCMQNGKGEWIRDPYVTLIYKYVLNKQRLPITVLKIDQTVKQDLSIKAVELFFLQNISWNIFTESLYKSLMTVAIALSQKIECNMKSSSKQGLDKYIYHLKH